MRHTASITPFHWNCSSRITTNLDAKNPWVFLKFPLSPHCTNWHYLTSSLPETFTSLNVSTTVPWLVSFLSVCFSILCRLLLLCLSMKCQCALRPHPSHSTFSAWPVSSFAPYMVMTWHLSSHQDTCPSWKPLEPKCSFSNFFKDA